MSIHYYQGLLADQPRIRAFRGEIEAAVTPDDIVLEIGTGLGTFAFFAARAGAAHVYAVDGDPIVHVADALARSNGHADQVTCIRGWVPDVDIPGQATLLIFEDFGTALLDTETYRLIRDSTRKYLAQGGRMIPGRATVYVAPVSSADVRQQQFPLEAVPDRFGLNWTQSLDYLRNSPQQFRLPAQALVGDPKRLYEAHFPMLPRTDEMGGEMRWDTEPGTAVHGLALWFDLDLGDGRALTNRPGDQTGPWGQLVLPLDPPVVVDNSGSLTATLRTDPTQDGAPGWTGWFVQSGPNAAGGHEFAGPPASLQDLLPTSETPAAGPHTSKELADVRL